IAIARAIISKPKFIVLDEPTSALDVSVQAQIINLLVELRENHDLTYMFISHDISVVKHISDRIAVMYLGNIVEIGPKDSVFYNRYHPYTRILISSVPLPDVRKKSEFKLDTSEVPSVFTKFSGCKFVSRCPYKMEVCEKEKPTMFKVSENHYVRCFLYKN
ncbi:MAG: ABC transporter ATP-binding protein, partial [Fervidobacterium sp.]